MMIGERAAHFITHPAPAGVAARRTVEPPLEVAA
jgi:hypothetical protein